MRSTSTVLLLALAVSSAASAASAPDAGSRTIGQPDETSATASVGAQGRVGEGEFSLPLRISPDSRYVVERRSEGVFSRRLPDGPVTQLSPAITCLDETRDWLITDDSETVLFLCQESEVPFRVLWAVPIGGPASAAVILSVTPDEPPGVNGIFSATSGSRVFYAVSRNETGIDLLSVPAEGPASQSVAIHPGLGELEMAVAPFALQASRRVVYFLYSIDPRRADIWLTDPMVPSPVLIGLSPPTHPVGQNFVVSPNEQRVAWSASSLTSSFRIYSAPVSDLPGTSIHLNPDMPASTRASVQAISPDSSRVLFSANPTDPARYDLWSVPIDGPGSLAVNLTASVQAWNPIVRTPRFSPDGAWLLYVAGREVEDRWDLYRVPAAGPASANLRLNPVEGPPAIVREFDLVPATTDVVFSLERGSNPDQTMRCYRGSWLGAAGNATPLWTEWLRPAGVGIACHWHEESQGVLTIARDPTTSREGLWLAHSDGALEPRPKKVLDAADFEPDNGPFREPIFLAVSANGRYVVYIATPLGGTEGLWVLQLPFFWDGFESAGTTHWSATQD